MAEYPTIIYVSRHPVLPPGELTGTDVVAIYARLDVLEEGLAVGEINDVDLTGLADGNVLVYDLDTETWVPSSPQTGIAVETTGGVMLNPQSTRLLFGNGMTATDSGEIPGERSVIGVVFGGTGSLSTVARSDHAHTAELFTLATGAATGVLSSGTRELRNAAGPALQNGITYDVRGEFEVRARNNVDSGTVNLLCRIGSEASYPQRSRNVQTVGGVPDPLIIRFRAVIVGTGASVTEYFAVQHSSGSVTDLRDHEIDISYRPRR